MFDGLRFHLRSLLRRRVAETNLDEELRLHLDRAIEEKIARGVSPAEARRAARLEFGGLDQVKEQVRDVWASSWVDQLWQDLRYGSRTLARTPALTTTAVLTLMLAISVACVIVSAAVRAERSPVVPEADRLLCFYPFDIEHGRFTLFSYPEFVQLRDLSHDTMSLAAVGVDLELTVLLPERAIRAAVAVVSGNYFAVLGSPPTLGRPLTPSDDIAGATPVVMLAERAWEAFFERDPDIVGQMLRIGAFEYTVIGVASNPLTGPAYEPDVWVPLAQTVQLVPADGADVLKRPTASWLTFVGRMRPDIDLRQVESFLAVATPQLSSEDGASMRRDEWRIDALPVNRVSLGPETHETTTRLLFVLTLLTVGFLLAACSNTTLLMVTRGAERAHELAVRSALGATTANLVRLRAWEVLMLVALGSAMALVALPWIGRLVAMPQLADLALTTTIDRYTVITLCLIAVSVAVVILAGTALGIEARLKWRGLGLDHGPRVTRRTRLRQVLVIVQVALSCVLLVAAGLLVQSARAVASIPPGFVPDVLVTQLFTPTDRYTPEETNVFYERLRASLLDQTLVSSVGLAWHAPLSEMYLSVLVEVPGTADPEPTSMAGNIVSPGYFETLGVPVLNGRAFLRGDDLDAPPVVIVNRSFAERWWPTRPAVGREIVLPRSGGRRRVVGVVENVRYRTLTEPAQPLVYLPLAQRFQPWVFVHLRTASDDPMLALSTVWSAVADLDPQIGVGAARTLEDDVNRSLAEWRGPASLSGVLGLVTLLLTMGGLYATLASLVSQRTKEMAIRRALGAQDSQVRRLIIGQGLLLAAVGLVLGLGATTVVMGYVESFLYGVAPRDVSTQVAVAGLIGLVAWLSCRVPADRAAKADPMMALRAE